MELNSYRFPREKILIPHIFWTHYDYDYDYDDYKYGAFTISGCLDIEVTNLYLKINLSGDFLIILKFSTIVQKGEVMYD